MRCALHLAELDADASLGGVHSLLGVVATGRSLAKPWQSLFGAETASLLIQNIQTASQVLTRQLAHGCCCFSFCCYLLYVLNTVSKSTNNVNEFKTEQIHFQ